MSEDIKLEEMIKDDNIVGHCIMCALSNWQECKDIFEQIKQDKKATIYFTINGREFPLTEFLARFQKQYHENIVKTAMEMFDEKFGQLHETMYEAVRTGARAMKDHFRTQFPDYYWDDRD